MSYLRISSYGVLLFCMSCLIGGCSSSVQPPQSAGSVKPPQSTGSFGSAFSQKRAERERAEPLHREAHELVSIMVASRKSTLGWTRSENLKSKI